MILCKYSKQKVTLGTRVLTRVTSVNVPQKEVHVDIKEIVKENSKPAQKKLEKK